MSMGMLTAGEEYRDIFLFKNIKYLFLYLKPYYMKDTN